MVNKNIGLNLTKRTRPDKTSFDIRAPHLTSWLNNLPRANIGATAKQLYSVLRETNKLDYPYKKRMQFLDALQECLISITESMEKHYVGANLPLSDKNQKVANLTKKLFSYMATGYKISLQDAVNNSQLFGKKSLLGILAHRSINYIGKTILTSYQSYSQFPNLLWSELHKIYLFSENQNISDIVFDKTSVMDEYSKILLLSLASPSHLQHGESRKVYAALERWLTQPLINTFNSAERTADCFIIDLSHASAPSLLSSVLAERQPNENSLRIISTHEISKKVKHEIQNNESINNNSITAKKDDLTNNLLQRLLVSWDIKTKRNFPRITKNEDIKITVGLSAIHQLISHKNQKPNKKKKNKFTAPSQFTATDVSHDINIARAENEDIWNIIYKPENNYDFEENALLEDGEETGKYMQVNSYTPDDWLIMNESKMGLSINNRDELNNKVEVGELVCITRTVDEKYRPPNIGVIRWLRFNADESLQLGIEVLNRNSAAIGIRAGDKPLQRALILPELTQMKQPAFLVTAPALWKKGDKIAINMQGKEVSVILTNTVQNTGLFTQFEFEIDSDAPMQTETSVQNKNKLKESDIWSLI